MAKKRHARELFLSDLEISALFAVTNFGDSGKTEVGRRGLLVDCVLQRAAGYHCGRTITRICVEAGLLSSADRPRLRGLRWAFNQLHRHGYTILERLRVGDLARANTVSQ